MKKHDQRRLKRAHALLLTVAVLNFTAGAILNQAFVSGAAARPEAAAQKDDDAAREAFQEVYRVLMHPRCMNCHPSGEAPLQGDDNRLHIQNVKRGPDGKGLYALKCANCHQDVNLAGDHMPPGNPNWHLPPAKMPMVFQGKTPGELARQLKDPKQNGGKTLEQIFQHIAEDKLVLWGWDPGNGRTKPPLSHAEFVRKFREWIDKGAAAPE
jgi:cytochrome c5